MNKPTKAQMKQLEAIIGKLEAWQIRYREQQRHTTSYETSKAKDLLIAVLHRLESDGERGAQ